MIGIDSQIGEQKRLTAWLVTASVWLDCHEHRVNLSEGFRVITFENPTLFSRAVFVENTKINRLFSFRPAPAPGLECTGSLYLALTIQVVGVEDQRLPFRVKHSAIRLLSLTASRNIINF